MFVTEEISPVELISELLCGNPSTEEDTRGFIAHRHNNSLCPRFTDSIKQVLATYQKHRVDVHDIQGFQDKGCDVAIQLDTDDGIIKVGLQIKSHKEIEDYARGRDKLLISKLRNQYTQAIQEAKVDHYYLILCGDAKAHRNELRTITAALVNYASLKIVHPSMAFGFFSMDGIELDVAVIRILCARDFVLRKARASVAEFPPGALPVIMALICRALSGEASLVHDEYEKLLVENYDDEEATGDELSELMASLNGDLVEEIDALNYKIVPDAYPAICAIYYEQLAKFGGQDAARERTQKLLISES